MRLRLLPVLIVTATVALTARVGELWHGFGAIAQAQTTAPAEVPESSRAAATPSAQQAPAPAAASEQPASAGSDPGAQLARTRDVPPDPLSMTDQEIELLQALADRRRELQLRSQQIDQREVLLKAAERRIDEKVVGLKALHKSIQDLLLEQDEQTENQYKSLVKIYETMKPKDAARIFEELEMAVLLPVVERMKERKTAPILAKMNPIKAKALTVELAKRRELTTPKE
ncbi:MAG: hypothetical protein V3S40_06690 [Kiloniellales bacterium]